MTKFTWKRLAETPQSRCLIPLTSFAEPEGPKGAKTRTWVTIKDQPIAAWGGLWRDSDEWGAVYSGAMTDCNEAMRPLHHRMPVLLLPDEFDRWLHGSFDDVVAFQNRAFPDGLIEITPTQDLWVPKKLTATLEKATLI
ncbi:SOS response associated peptidase (SRAP) [Rhodospirillales bacterium URHD0017]|nr:SOS response associated peptidase (SRAP) [Rhodospirillales bacterium URHD0017]